MNMNAANNKARLWPLAWLCAALAGLPGCGKVNKENYDKLKMGMGYAAVVEILGEPERCDALLAAKSCVWGKDAKTIKIQLVGDHVILFESQGL